MGLEEATQYIFKAVGYEPTPAQWEVHRDPSRHKLVTGGNVQVSPVSMLWRY